MPITGELAELQTTVTQHGGRWEMPPLRHSFVETLDTAFA